MLINEGLKNYFRSKSWKHLEWAKKGAKNRMKLQIYMTKADGKDRLLVLSDNNVRHFSPNTDACRWWDESTTKRL